MKLLADTSVWSLALRRGPAATLSPEEKRLVAVLTEAIRDGQVAMIGPIRQELLSGIKEQAQFEKLRTALAAFRDEPIDTPDYEEAARLYNVCRSQGVQCGPVGILICAVAVRRKWSVLANDTRLNQCLQYSCQEPMVSVSKSSRAGRGWDEHSQPISHAMRKTRAACGVGLSADTSCVSPQDCQRQAIPGHQPRPLSGICR